ncbi:MAG: right-handed parallel beta-helix repeat-containing protein [Candidatus Poseidoniaceae archaeon]|jgi:hypothetical protein|nr:right-handed parallel beta-helix repeat-containing protein [Candidatus Poseidoniaceae archaeon]
MAKTNQRKSIGLVTIMLFSLFASMTVVPSVSAVNETKSGTITGTETWTGNMNLEGDILVAGGAKLVINAGTTINVPANRSITIQGAICAGDSSCGASQASTGSPVRFLWGTPGAGTDLNQSRCYVQATSYNPDAACASGIYLDSTIDQSLTKLNHVTIDGAYGIPVAISQSQIKYGALVFDGASLEVNALTFVDINTTNVLAINGASPSIDGSTFVVGADGQGYQGAAIQAYGAGAGLVKMQVTNSAFTGNEADCGTQGGGRSAIYLEDSFVNMDTLSITQNSYGAFLRSSSGSLTNSTVNVKCNAIDTNSHLTTNDFNHTFVISNNALTTEEGAGVTAYDGAIVVAENNQISGASGGSGFGIRSSEVTINNNIIGPIEGYNGLWIYGESDVIAENNTIMNTAKEPVLLGEYHFKDQGWNVPAPTKSRLYFANNIIENNTGTCNSDYMYGGDFLCPAFHVFMSSATFVDNTVTNSAGDGFLIKGGIVHARGNTMEVGQFAANITHFDDNYGNKYGSIAYFADNTYTNATQIYNVSESRVSVQSEFMPAPGGGYPYPVMLSWLSADCEVGNLDECLQVPPTGVWPPRDMPLSMEVNEAATVFAFADVVNFDTSKIYVQNQNQGWNVQVEKGELVRYQVKSDNSQVADADVVIMDAAGKPLYNMTTDPYGYTPWITLASDFHIDTSWDHDVTDTNENSCNDRIDNDGDTLTDGEDSDCQNGNRELPVYMVKAGKFGKGSSEHQFILTGMVDEVINLANIGPSVSLDQPDGFSFARTITLTGTAHDGIVGPYFNDYDSYLSQYGTVTRVEVQPHGSQDWYLATDTSGANGVVNMTNWPFKSWSFDWDMSNHFEEDITFRVRSFDGVDESITSSRVFKLNINPPTINLETPLDGSTHSGSSVLFSGTAADDYSGVQGSDIQDIWFSVVGPSNYSANYPANSGGGTAWSDSWEFSALPTGSYTFTVWASDSNYCTQTVDICESDTITLFIDNDNQRPFVQVESPLPMEVVRAAEDTLISGVARDNDGAVTRVEISVWDLAGGFELNTGPDPITSFLPNGYWETYWDTSKLIHDQQYEIYVKSYDGEDYSDEEIVRIKIDNPTNADNIAPIFTPVTEDGENWPETIIIFCDENSNNQDRCNEGASVDLTDFFYDPDDPTYAGLQCYPFNDPLTALDDVHFQRITMSNSYHVANYNPVDWTGSLSEEITEWSLTNVIFTCRDAYDSIAISFSINFIVKGVSFSVERVDEGNVIFGKPSEWQGTGLPGSTVFARNVAGSTMVNSTVVMQDGTWSMLISSAQLPTEGNNEIFFVQDDQKIGHPDEGDSPILIRSGEPISEGLATWIWILIAVVAIVALLGVGAFFFLEFEEEEYIEDEEAELAAQKEEDPYAWAKARAAEQAVAAVQAPVPVEQSQHPGWIWDAQSNQWIPDPNYQPPQQ